MRTAAICPTCATYENAICVLYDGPYLPCTGISPLDSIAEALAKIDAAICALTTTTTTSSTSSTTTTTTTITCATPTLNSATSDGFGNVTLDYDLNGSTLCTFVLAEYSDYPSFSPLSFSETIPDGCDQTSYILTLNTSSTQYVRVSMICDGNTLNSNILSVVPGTTTTTTTVNACTAPVITDISTNGAYPEATVTIDYNVNGIVDVLSLTLWYSLDPNFEGTVFTDTISNLNITSYSFPMTGTSTWYFKLRKVCGTDPEFPTGESYSNVVSIAPQPTTTTTTTTLNCVYPTLDNLTTDGFGNMTLTYDLHGSSCSGVFAEYSSDSGFPDPVSGQIIFNGCNLTSYVLNVPSESTLYVRVSTTCGQLSLIGNALSIIPGVPTTTTTTTVV